MVMSELRGLHIRMSAMEAIIAEVPGARERYEVLLRAAELELLLEPESPPVATTGPLRRKSLTNLPPLAAARDLRCYASILPEVT
jgi:hypothetical protein